MMLGVGMKTWRGAHWAAQAHLPGPGRESERSPPQGWLTEAQSDSTGGGTGPASGDPAQEAPSEEKGLCSWGGRT